MNVYRPFSKSNLASVLTLVMAVPLASVAGAANAPFTGENEISDVPSGIYPELQLVDLTGDGAPEIIYNGQNSDLTDNIYILENDGAGAGWMPRPLDPEMLGADEFFVIDMDGDGDQDVVAHGDGNDGSIEGIFWYANGGEGKFWERHPVIEGQSFFWDSLVAADMDGDGDMDIVTGRASDMLILVNPGDDGAWSETTVSAHAQFQRVRRIVTADFDGDGDNDIVANAGDYGDTLEFLRNDGGGAFSATLLDAQDGIAAMTVVDIDGDGNLDVLGEGRLQALIYENSGTGQFVATELDNSGNVLLGAQMATFDLDDDGDLDILRARAQDRDDDAVAVFVQDGGAFTPSVIVTAWQLGTRGDSFLNGAKGIDAGDIDCDGDIDFVLSGSEISDNGQRLTWFENNTSTEAKGSMCGGTGGGSTGSGGAGSGGAGSGGDSGTGTGSGTGGANGGDDTSTGGCAAGGGSDDGLWLSLLLGLGLYFGGRRRK